MYNNGLAARQVFVCNDVKQLTRSLCRYLNYDISLLGMLSLTVVLLLHSVFS